MIDREPLDDVIAKATRDEAFKARLMNDPKAVLEEAGFELPDGLAVRVVENTDRTMHLVLPVPPEGDLSQAELKRIAGGSNDSNSSLPDDIRES